MEELHTFFAALTGLISLSKSLLCTSRNMEERRGVPEAIPKVRRSHAHVLHANGHKTLSQMEPIAKLQACLKNWTTRNFYFFVHTYGHHKQPHKITLSNHTAILDYITLASGTTVRILVISDQDLHFSFHIKQISRDTFFHSFTIYLVSVGCRKNSPCICYF